MQLICSYCNRKVGEKSPLEDTRKTHGICDTCFNRLLEEHKKKRADKPIQK